jgi:hypothetical protein
MHFRHNLILGQKARPAAGPVDYKAPREVRRFKTLAEYQRATGQDRHSRLIDYSVFVNAAPPDFTNATHLFAPADAGLALPGVTDGFNGRAPDLGAYEFGAEIPHYGPRDQVR